MTMKGLDRLRWWVSWSLRSLGWAGAGGREDSGPGLARLEPLEPRVMLHADLVGFFGEGFGLDSPLVPGDVLTVPIVVEVADESASNGTIGLEVFASADLVLDEGEGGDALIGSLENQRILLEPGQSRAFNVRATVPFDDENLPPGAYFLIGRITADEGADEEPGNNLITENLDEENVAAELVWRFGNVPGRSRPNSLTVVEADGLRATFVLAGPGFGEVGRTGEGLWNVTFTDTEATSQAIVAVRGGDGPFELDSITAPDPLGGVIAKNVDLTGDATFSGGIRRLILDDVEGLSTIEIGPSADENASTLILLDRASDLSIDSDMPINSLILSELIDTDDVADTVSAPSIGRIIVRGNRAEEVEGDFEANLDLSGSEDDTPTLLVAIVFGGLGDGVWEIEGDAGRIIVRGEVDGWGLDVMGGLGLLNLSDVADAEVEVEGDLGVARALRWLEGSLTAGKITSLITTGNRRAGIEGDFGAMLTVGDPEEPSDETILTRLLILGTLSEEARIHGNALRLSIGKLRDELEIDGDATLITLNEFVSIIAADEGAGGSMNVGGATRIRTLGGFVSLTDGSLFSSETGELYALEDLLLFDQVGTTWNYQGEVTVGRDTGAIEFSRTVEGTEEIDGLTGFAVEDDVTSVEDPDEDDDDLDVDAEDLLENDHVVWFFDDSGAFVLHIGSEADESDDDFSIGFEFDLEDLQVAPPALVLGELHRDSASFTGQITIIDPELDDAPLVAVLNGTASVQTRLIGHEQVTVPLDTYLAAKIELWQELEGTATVNIPSLGTDLLLTVTESDQMTLWAVPEVGIVRQTNRVTATARGVVPGLGSESFTVAGTADLGLASVEVED